MELYYKHAKRKITDETGKEYSYLEAEKVWKSGLVSDCNVAFRTLYNFDGNMNAVENYYKNVRAR